MSYEIEKGGVREENHRKENMEEKIIQDDLKMRDKRREGRNENRGRRRELEGTGKRKEEYLLKGGNSVAGTARK